MWDRFEMHIHERIIDLHAPADIVKHSPRAVWYHLNAPR